MPDLQVAQATVEPGGAGPSPGALPNAAPEAADDCAITAESTPIQIPVLANDRDGDGDGLIPDVTAPPEHGRTTVNADGTITYAPAAGADAPRDGFTYQLSDGLGGTDEARVFVLVNQEGGRPGAQPNALAGLDDAALSSLAQACAAGTALAVTELGGANVVVAPPDPGERVRVDVEPGQSLTLRGAEFADARYVPVGEGLLVLLPDGRVVFLAGFAEAAGSGNPPTLSVDGAPAVPGDQLLARLEGGEPPIPTAGPEHGGGAGFTPYDPGAIGPGLDPLGPLGPTALGNRLALVETRALAADDGGGDGDGEDNRPPRVEGTSPLITGPVEEISRGFDFVSARPFPTLEEQESLAEEQINGVDQGNLRLNEAADAEIVFVDEVAKQRNALGVYLIGPDGAIQDPRMVFPVIEHADPLPGVPSSIRPGGGPLSPGDSVRLSDLYGDDLAPGTEFGLFLVVDPRIDLSQGTLEFVDGNPQQLRFVPSDGGEPIVLDGPIFHTDPSLNPGGQQQVVSGLQPATSGIDVGFEDRPPGHPDNDQDFNDIVFRVKVPPVTDPGFVPDPLPIAGDLTVTDPDDAELARATVTITEGQDGDTLTLVGPVEVGGDGTVFVDGQATGITAAFLDGDRRLVLEGQDGVDTYQTVLRSVALANPDATPGERQVSFEVEDPHGAESNLFTVTVDVPATIVGDDGDNDLPGTEGADALSGRGGDDVLRGEGGNDILDGGDGDDELFGGADNDVLRGGVGIDDLDGGAGADRYVYTSLDDRGDRIFGFDADAGDRLVLDDLLDGFGAGDNINDFVRLSGPDADGNRVVSVDIDGTGDVSAPVEIATLVAPANVTGVADLVETPDTAAAAA